jgi:RNA polymerase sigma factor (TIGR02999 family)
MLLLRPYMRKTQAKTVTFGGNLFEISYEPALLDSQVSQTTQLLLAWEKGDPMALEALTPLVYRELRRIAGTFMKSEREPHTLQATALVHEVYLRLIDVKNVHWEGKAHFFALCAKLMRRILVDAARKRGAPKHGGALGRVDLDQVPDLSGSKDAQLLALNDALDELGQADSRKARVVELRYFGGLSVVETAAVLRVSEETITREWRFARGWLLSQLTAGEQRGRAQRI